MRRTKGRKRSKPKITRSKRNERKKVNKKLGHSIYSFYGELEGSTILLSKGWLSMPNE